MNNLIQRVNRFDKFTFLWLHVTLQIPCMSAIRWISRTGDGHLYLLAGLVAFYVDRQSGTTFITAVLYCFALERTLYWVLKNTIRRDRPEAGIESFSARITPSDQFSFPSGHTAAAFMFAMLVLQYYPVFALPCYLWATMVGASRVLLGVHYPTDIAAGALLGTTCATVGLNLI